MTALSRNNFLKTLPATIKPLLPEPLQVIQSRQQWSWLIQFHFGEPRLHYEVSPVRGRPVWELGFHFEAKDKTLNRYLLLGFRRHLFEIKDVLGEQIEAEMWDRGWTKIYELFPGDDLTTAYQLKLAARLALIITCLQPIFAELRGNVAQVYR